MAVPQGVGQTAIRVAAVRAQESLRADRLFDDPFAVHFLDAAGWPRPPAEHADSTDGADGAEVERRLPPRWLAVVLSIPIRTRFVDDYLAEALDAGCRQVVLLGAGLDTRAYRLHWPAGTRVFELDLPQMLTFKQTVLDAAGAAPACERYAVPADLTADWAAALGAAGFDARQPVAWIAEGLLMYLSVEQNERLLTEVGALSAAGSRLALTVLTQDRLDQLREQTDDGAPGSELVGLWRSGVPADTEGWLAGHGWRAELFGSAERAAAYGRPNLFDGQEGRPTSRALVRAVRTR